MRRSGSSQERTHSGWRQTVGGKSLIPTVYPCSTLAAASGSKEVQQLC